MRNAADKVDMISHPIDSTVFGTEWHNPSFSSMLQRLDSENKITEVKNGKD